MAKDFIKKYLPDPETVKQNKALSFLGDLLHDPCLWHLNRKSVVKAFALGIFWACIPIPFQMVCSALIAVKIRANIPLSVALVWISNPITMPPIFYFEYLVGAWILDTPALAFEYELSVDWILSKLYEVGVPMFLGAVVCGIVFGAIASTAVNILWRQNIKKRWRLRQERRA